MQGSTSYATPASARKIKPPSKKRQRQRDIVNNLITNAADLLDELGTLLFLNEGGESAMRPLLQEFAWLHLGKYPFAVDIPSTVGGQTKRRKKMKMVSGRGGADRRRSPPQVIFMCDFRYSIWSCCFLSFLLFTVSLSLLNFTFRFFIFLKLSGCIKSEFGTVGLTPYRLIITNL